MIIVSLTQYATLWKKLTLNANGEWTYSDPVDFLCRWEGKVSKFMSMQGVERIGSAVIYHQTEGLLDLDDKVRLGSRNSLLARLPSSTLDAIAAGLAMPRATLDGLLALPAAIPGLNYGTYLKPFSAPDVRTIGFSGASPPVGGGLMLYKLIAE